MTPDSEQMTVARQAARAARRANIIAAAALIVAVIAVAISVMPLFLDQADPLSAAVRAFLDSI